ncbi:hypothetical protein O9992_02115 [Vibrio lentus]|nr:hypothetical protein [Vibrio lentus]
MEKCSICGASLKVVLKYARCISDFLLSVDELDIVVLNAKSHEKTLSLRSECSNNNVANIVKRALNDKGIVVLEVAFSWLVASGKQPVSEK